MQLFFICLAAWLVGWVIANVFYFLVMKKLHKKHDEKLLEERGRQVRRWVQCAVLDAMENGCEFTLRRKT